MKIYDALLHTGKPDLGFEVMPLWYENNPMPADESHAKTVLDLESKSMYSPALVQENGYFYVQKLFEYRKANPLVGSVALYGHIQTDNGGNVLTQQEAIDIDLEKEALASMVDFIAPPLYARDDDAIKWIANTREYIARCKTLGKPVIPFLWYKYPQGYSAIESERYIPKEFMRIMLETLENLEVDGVILWGGWQEPWDDNAEWWLETQDYISS